MPAGGVCLHRACGRSEAQHSVPAMHLQSLKVVGMKVVLSSWLIYAFHLKLLDMCLLVA